MSPEAPTVPALLAQRRSHDGQLQALVTAEEAVTWAALDDRSRDTAAALVGAGVAKGSRVGLLMANGIDWATVAMAVMRCGAVLVPLSTLLRPPELLAQLRVAAVTHLVAVPSYRGRRYLEDLEQVAPGIGGLGRALTRHPAVPSLRALWRADELPSTGARADIAVGLEATVRAADDLAIMFTSGSRGEPKGVVHTHGGALRATAAGLDCRRIGPGERLYIPMPFFWMGGFGAGLLSVLVAGATLLTEATPEPEATLAFLERERVTLFRGWPDQGVAIAAHPRFASTDLSGLRAGSLGAVLPAPLRARPGARANLFGMTESFGPYCGDRLDTDLPPSAQGSCGRPFPGIEVAIVDPGTGAALDAGIQGEIRLRGPNMMRGICRRVRSEVFSADGFYPTGDLGALDGDGYLFYRGRLDDMFKVKGATVYPSEVEAALRSLPGVTQAHVADVIGAAGTPVVGALVVVAGPTDATSLDAGARQRLSAFKVPTLWSVTTSPGDVPLLATGKLDKAALQRLLVGRGRPARA